LFIGLQAIECILIISDKEFEVDDVAGLRFRAGGVEEVGF
jgi:hypothetical protein